MATSTITVAGINPSLNILGPTQQLNFNQNLSTFQLNNLFIPTSLISSQTNSEFRNNALSGFRWVHLTSYTDTYGSLTLQSFVNASSSGTNLISFSSGGINLNSQIITNGTWNGATITVPYGGTGFTSATAYGVLCGGTTSTAALQSVSAGTSGQVLTSGGSSALPTWTTPTVGTVTSIIAGTGLSGGTITSTGTIAIATTGVTAGSYTAANITVNAQGQLTIASNSSAVIGPASAVSNNVATFDTTTGKLIKDSGIAISSVVTALGSGAAATCGTGTLVVVIGVPTATVPTTAILSTSIVNITRNSGTSLLANAGALSVGNISSGVSFDVYSSNPADTGTFYWQVVNPS